MASTSANNRKRDCRLGARVISSLPAQMLPPNAADSLAKLLFAKPKSGTEAPRGLAAFASA